MTSEVQICNMALASIRSGSINALTESSLQAQQCNLWYDFLRDKCLEDASWGFSKKEKYLAVLSNDNYDLFNWAYTYQYPSDCLKINRLKFNYEEVSNETSDFRTSLLRDEIDSRPNLKNQIPYEIYNIDGKKVIGANFSQLRVNYRSKVTDSNLYSQSFILALSQLLGAHIAVSIAGVKEGSALKKTCLDLYGSYINTAIADDLNEGYEEPPDSEMITVRS